MGEDRLANWREMPKFQERRTSLGFLIFPVFHRMIPERDPDRDGKEWYEREKASSTDKNWRSEQEIDFEASSGGLIYPEFDIRRDVLLYPIKPLPHWDFTITIDPGVTVTAALFSCLSDQGYAFHLAEYYEGTGVGAKNPLSATDHAEALIRRAQQITDEICGVDDRTGRSNVEWDHLFKTHLLDASSWRREGAREDLGSVAQRYMDAGFDFLEKGTRDLRGGIQRVLEWERRSTNNEHPNVGVNDWAYPQVGWPKKFANPNLTHYISEKIHYHYGPDGEQPEEHQMDHLCDCERIVLVHFRENPMAPDEIAPEKTAIDIRLEWAMREPNQRGRLCLPKKTVYRLTRE